MNDGYASMEFAVARNHQAIKVPPARATIDRGREELLEINKQSNGRSA